MPISSQWSSTQVSKFHEVGALTSRVSWQAKPWYSHDTVSATHPLNRCWLRGQDNCADTVLHSRASQNDTIRLKVGLICCTEVTLTHLFAFGEPVYSHPSIYPSIYRTVLEIVAHSSFQKLCSIWVCSNNDNWKITFFHGYIHQSAGHKLAPCRAYQHL